MNKRMKMTVSAACALLMCLITVSAIALIVHSTANVDYGSTTWSTAGTQDLFDNSLYGCVHCTFGRGTASQTLRGEMWTKGVIFAIRRDYAEVVPNGSDLSLGWSNPDQETGEFYARARALYGNHEGYARVSQSGH